MAVGKSSIARAASAKKAAEAENRQENAVTAPAPAEVKTAAKKPAAGRSAAKKAAPAVKKSGNVVYSVGQSLPVHLL